MKNLALLLALALLAGSGCARNYVIKLNNGRELTATNKPKLKEGAYYYTDVAGQERHISKGRVTEIEPASMATAEKEAFKPKKVKK